MPCEMLKSWDLISFDKLSLNSMEDSQKLYEKLCDIYYGQSDSMNKGHKNHLRYQIAEMLEESGELRIAINHILFVYHKFRILLNDLSREDP